LAKYGVITGDIFLGQSFTSLTRRSCCSAGRLKISRKKSLSISRENETHMSQVQYFHFAGEATRGLLTLELRFVSDKTFDVKRDLPTERGGKHTGDENILE